MSERKRIISRAVFTGKLFSGKGVFGYETGQNAVKGQLRQAIGG